MMPLGNQSESGFLTWDLALDPVATSDDRFIGVFNPIGISRVLFGKRIFDSDITAPPHFIICNTGSLCRKQTPCNYYALHSPFSWRPDEVCCGSQDISMKGSLAMNGNRRRWGVIGSGRKLSFECLEDRHLLSADPLSFDAVPNFMCR